MDVVQLWKDASNDTLASAVVSIFVLICLILLAVYVVGWFRNLALGEEEPLNPLADIEKLRGEGKISPFEYQRLKQVAAQSLKNEGLGKEGLGKEGLPHKQNQGNQARPLTLKEAQQLKAAQQNQTPPASSTDDDHDQAIPES